MLLLVSLYQRTPLHIAVEEGQEYTVECLVKIGADINIQDNDEVTDTILAVAKLCCYFN